ncbi:GNAT family N-acetyltransferase [Pontimicrobium aquaticum]|uniref:GNAT family N-acetyltransferase n=1 Tax=Pontimicrobium aquaticum TaxID=2565367 RepID=A0A4U0F363_9FLAO|nr:GNAT family N-acetyltransferase [Pontimicrobium aquaticum]
MIVKTSRLIISKATLKDAPFFLEIMNSPNWIKYIGDRNVKTVKEAETYLEKGIIKSYHERGYGFYKVALKSNPSATIGICGLIKREELEIPDLGFAMLPLYEGIGYGYESSVSVLEEAKKKFGITKVGAITLQSNLNSIKLLEKLGFSFEKRIKLFDDDQELLFFVKELL